MSLLDLHKLSRLRTQVPTSWYSKSHRRSDEPDRFWPLCQSEYRDGFTECADCHVHLVVSRAEAKASSARPWKGDRQNVLDKVLAALDAQGIPWYFHEIVNAGPQVTAFGIPFTPRKSTFEYEVGVFRSDLEKAPTAGADFI